MFHLPTHQRSSCRAVTDGGGESDRHHPGGKRPLREARPEACRKPTRTISVALPVIVPERVLLVLHRDRRPAKVAGLGLAAEARVLPPQGRRRR